jgi:hypothetical protein
MKKEYFFEKITDLKTRFKSFFQHRKKIAALENFTENASFPHRNYLTLIKGCMTDGFLEDKEADFLDHMLNKYELNYLDWAHRTKWLKGQIAARQTFKPLATQVFFDFDKKQSPVNVPIELLAAKTQQRGARL